MAARCATRVRICGSFRNLLPSQINFTHRSLLWNHRTISSETTYQQSKANTDTPDKAEGASSKIPELTELEKELDQKVKELDEKFHDVNDKYMRALAESENIRTRMQRQINEAKQFGIQSFCKDLLDVADVLNKATESVPKEELGAKNPHLQNLYEGLLMTESQLQKVFKNHGLKKVDPLGEKFDPNFHEAVFEQPFEGKEPGTVAIVTKIGYCLHQRTIRPAVVGVVKK